MLPHTVMAETHAFEQSLVLFYPHQGAFPEPDPANGLRLPLIGETLTDFPQNPVREGYVFDGWQIYDGPRAGERVQGSLHVDSVSITLRPVWVSYGDAPAATPAPEATPSPEATPTPTPAAATPSPTPASSSDAGRPNPTTSPLAISILIFIAVLTLGVAAFAIIKLMANQALATGRYRVDAARYAREARLAELLRDEIHSDIKTTTARSRRRRRRRRMMY